MVRYNLILGQFNGSHEEVNKNNPNTLFQLNQINQINLMNQLNCIPHLTQQQQSQNPLLDLNNNVNMTNNNEYINTINHNSSTSVKSPINNHDSQVGGEINLKKVNENSEYNVNINGKSNDSILKENSKKMEIDSMIEDVTNNQLQDVFINV
jgi:hypothetical protein